MNRKLHNSLLALSATSLMLALTLLTATPLPHAGQHGTGVPLAVAATAPILPVAASAQARVSAARAAAIQARSQAFQARLARSNRIGDSLALALAFAAEVSTEAALAAALAEAQTPAGAAPAAGDDSVRQRHDRRHRSALALPYFSFAQGLRRNTRS